MKSINNNYLKYGIKNLLNDKKFLICAFAFMGLLFIIILLNILSPYSYNEMDKTKINLSPFEYSNFEIAKISKNEFVFPHIFGTDNFGRDYFSRISYGIKVSLLISTISSLLIITIGFMYGTLSAYYGGKTDQIMLNISNIIYSIPDMMLVILLSILVQQVLKNLFNASIMSKLSINIAVITLIFTLLYWVNPSKIIRSKVLSLKNENFIVISKIMGIRDYKIILRHILPNCLNTLITLFIFQIPTIIFTESYLSFIGLGINSSFPSLGNIISESRTAISSYPHRLFIPCITLITIVTLLNAMGESLRDNFDPKKI